MTKRSRDFTTAELKRIQAEKAKKPTKAERERAEECARGAAKTQKMVRATLHMAIRDLTLDELITTWWEAQAQR